MGHGPNSSENVIKNGQINVRIVTCQEEMGKIHSYHDTCISCLKICWYEFFALAFDLT